MASIEIPYLETEIDNKKTKCAVVRLSDDYDANEGPLAMIMTPPTAALGMFTAAVGVGICIGSLYKVPDNVFFTLLVASHVLTFGSEMQRPTIMTRRYATNALGCLLTLDAVMWLAN